MKQVVIIGIFVVLLAGFASGHSFTGKVTRVVDGDTICVQTFVPFATFCSKSCIRVRLAEIDAPEKKQSFGLESRAALAEKIYGKTVRIDFTRKDRYGRIIGHIFLASNPVNPVKKPSSLNSINAQMIRDGFAWWYRKYSKDNNLSELETTARHQNRGLWTAKNPTAPWHYRRMRK